MIFASFVSVCCGGLGAVSLIQLAATRPHKHKRMSSKIISKNIHEFSQDTKHICSYEQITKGVIIEQQAQNIYECCN
jgi:hypothetical protein